MYNTRLTQHCDNCGNDKNACKHCCVYSAWIPRNFAIITDSGTFKLDILKVIKSGVFEKLGKKFKEIKTK
jgi:hypothetical protein